MIMKRIFILLCTLLAALPQLLQAQPQGGQQPPQRPMDGGEESTSWQVSVNTMNPALRRRISEVAHDMQQQPGADRSLIGDILKGTGFATVSSLIDVITTETVHLVKYRKEQKRKWMQMIQNECNYTDSLQAVKGLKDFYNAPSAVSALDPSDMNFDGISIRGMRGGQEMLYISCHIDTTRIEHLFRHSKFFLVVDTIAFHPYMCHLPNLMANGIRQTRMRPKGKGEERDNSFSYAERTGLSVGMDITLSSSWINEAVMLMQNVQLGKFRLNIRIPDGTQLYTYSRRAVERHRRYRDSADTTFVDIEGDCFVVPRSYMPMAGGVRQWGTGEYNMKVLFRESCQFSADATSNEKLRHWHRDYKQLRRMQHKGSEAAEYLRTVWQQNGNTFTKTLIKQALTTSAQAAHLTQTAGAGAAGMGGGAAKAGAGGGNGMPAGAPAGMKP